MKGYVWTSQLFKLANYTLYLVVKQFCSGRKSRCIYFEFMNILYCTLPLKSLRLFFERIIFCLLWLYLFNQNTVKNHNRPICENYCNLKVILHQLSIIQICWFDRMWKLIYFLFYDSFMNIESSEEQHFWKRNLL